MRDGDLGAGLFGGLIFGIVTVFVVVFILMVERLAAYVWRRVFGRGDDESTVSPPE